jgi:hypothetical protein
MPPRRRTRQLQRSLGVIHAEPSLRASRTGCGHENRKRSSERTPADGRRGGDCRRADAVRLQHALIGDRDDRGIVRAPGRHGSVAHDDAVRSDRQGFQGEGGPDIHRKRPVTRNRANMQRHGACGRIANGIAARKHERDDGDCDQSCAVRRETTQQLLPERAQ